MIEFFANLPNHWVVFLSSLLGVTIAQGVSILLFQRKHSSDSKVRLNNHYQAEYIEIYKLAREMTLALDSLFSIAHKKTANSKREFIVLAYELVRNNALAFIDKLDWRQQEYIIYLPRELEARCVRIRHLLYEGLSSTQIQSSIQVRHFRTNASKNYRTINIEQLEEWRRKGIAWPNILRSKRLDYVEASPFFDAKYVQALRDDLAFVSNYLKDVFTH